MKTQASQPVSGLNSNKPKLVILNNQSMDDVGGGPKIMRHLAMNLARFAEVRVLTNASHKTQQNHVCQIQMPAPLASRPVIWRFSPWRRAIHLVSALPHDEIRAADTVICLDCHFALALAMKRPKKLINLSLSVICQQETVDMPNGINRTLRKAQYQALESQMVKAADVTLVSSPFHKTELLKEIRRPQQGNVEILPPVFDLPRSGENKAPALMPKRRVELLAAGRLVPLKCYDLLIKLVSRLPDSLVRVTIAGDGPEKDRLRQCCAEYQVGDKVRFIGSSDSLSHYYNQMDAFIHPSSYESFGIVAIEAMACGLPVIGRCDVPTALSEIVQDGINGLMLNCSDLDLAASELTSLLQDHDRLRRLASGANNTAQSWMSYDYATRFEQILAQHLNVAAGDVFSSDTSA